MNCEDVRKSIPLMLYGELDFNAEEHLETHLDGCPACRQELERERTLHRALDMREIEPGPFELRKSRERLSAALDLERAPHSGWDWSRLARYFSMPALLKPAGALALLAAGFFGGRMVPSGMLPGAFQQSAVFDPNLARVRYVEPRPGGNIQIVLDETRQRVVSGRLDDAAIRTMLLSAVQDPSDPGLRVESVDLLKSRGQDDEVRSALVSALQHDTNPGVRLKALEGLKSFASHPEVRSALSHALLSDANPSIRGQAIDLLKNTGEERQYVGLLQEMMRRENNDFIRLRAQKALEAMKASVEIY